MNCELSQTQSQATSWASQRLSQTCTKLHLPNSVGWSSSARLLNIPSHPCIQPSCRSHTPLRPLFASSASRAQPCCNSTATLPATLPPDAVIPTRPSVISRSSVTNLDTPRNTASHVFPIASAPGPPGKHTAKLHYHNLQNVIQYTFHLYSTTILPLFYPLVYSPF